MPGELPIDKVLDRSLDLGRANVGFEVRRRLPGWPPGPSRMDGKVVLVTGAPGAAELEAPTATPGTAPPPLTLKEPHPCHTATVPACQLSDGRVWRWLPGSRAPARQ